ncbi:hypothetical protein COMNV_01148 [Commensalibacter sp. Nvir]|uniref:adenylate/guanylate cyclase domain-containing protein n=1 Tax=Commensalibacter sp. Nvir TaxID=3069817 RepID=UPI002D2B37D8|nr:hypothetical protein COMNV_01148 [Commensalibacter sp. Nvir]
MSEFEIVSPTKKNNDQFRKLFFRFAPPITIVVLVIIVVTVATYLSYQKTKSGILTLTHVILKSEQSRISQEVTSYLRPATSTSKIAIDMLSHVPPDFESGIFYTYAMSSLRKNQQIQSFYLSNEEGFFTMIERLDKDPNQVRVVTLTQNIKGGQFFVENKTLDGKSLNHKYVLANAYDPRKTQWYKAAIASQKLTWSRPVIVNAKQGLVVTASIFFVDRSGKKGVFAVNISLSKLASFLNSLNISSHSKAIIVDKEAHIIASPDFLLKMQDKDWQINDTKIDSVSHPILSAAYDHFLVNGSGIHSFDIVKDVQATKGTEALPNGGSNKKLSQGKKGTYISITSALPLSGQEWAVMIVIPERDYAHFAQRTGKQALFLSLLIILFAIVMASYLIYQAYRIERLDRAKQIVEQETHQEDEAVDRFLREKELFNLDNDGLELLEILCQVSSADQTSLWIKLEHEDTLFCYDTYSSKLKTHSGGDEIACHEISAILTYANKNPSFVVSATINSQLYNASKKFFSNEDDEERLIISAAQNKDGLLGIVIVKNPSDYTYLKRIINYFTGIVGLRIILSRLENQKTAGIPPNPDDKSPSLVERYKDKNTINPKEEYPNDNLLMGSTQLGVEGQNDKSSGIAIHREFTHAAILYMSFSEYLFIYPETVNTIIERVEKLAFVLQQIAEKYKLDYFKIMGGSLVGISGFREEADVTAPLRVAHAALEMRDACLDVIPHSDRKQNYNFGIGIEIGSVIGSWIGKNKDTFTSWGSALSMASLIANMSKDEGIVQVTSKGYEALKKDFLFRPRGSYFIPNFGSAHIYLLIGRK